MRYPALTRPFTLSGIQLQNRIVMSPMTTYGMPNPDGSSNERHRAYYEARAKGGVGLIIVESALVHLSGKCWPHQLCVYDDYYVPGLASLVATIKRHGIPVILQLHHGGRTALESLSGTQPIAPSPLPMVGRTDTPREMTIDDIEEQIEAYGQAARRAKDAGFDGVELHIGTSYLLLSFVSPAQNVRTDEYGRDFEGRMRFPLRIIERIRELCGAEYPIGARIVGSDYHDNGVDVAYCQRMAQRLEAAGIAWLDVSGGVGPNATKDSPLAMGYGEGVFADFAAAVKSVVSVPVMTVGRYYSLESAERVLAAGAADLAVLGRALIADPAIVEKSLNGDEDKVVPCIGCQACHGGASRALGSSCVLHPETGHEFELKLEPAEPPRRVLVIGGGVPGLELARVAALRGHHVTLATAGLPFGGLLALRAGVPGAEEVGRGVKYFRTILTDLGVEVVNAIPTEPFDVVVDSRPGTPKTLNVGDLIGDRLILGEAILAGETDPESLGHRIGVIGPGIFAGETALFLAAHGREVTLIASGDRAMQDANPLIAGKTALRLGQRGASILTGAEVIAAANGTLTVEVKGERREVGPFDDLVVAIGWEPLARPETPEAYVIADAWDAFAALLQSYEATKLAREL